MSIEFATTVTDLMGSLQRNAMPPPPLGPATSMARRGSEASPSRSSVQSSNASRIHTPSTSVPSTPLLGTRPASPEKRPLHSGESDNFLTALATQERRVLELKEELQKAELDLGKLKKQWAAHEAKKKRSEVRNLEQLQPLKTPLPDSATVYDESPLSASRELGRRKTLSNTRSSQRKVFSGSRHARTLSLLSTNRTKADPQYPPRGDSLSTKVREIVDTVETIPELGVPGKSPKSGKDPTQNSDRDMIIETGKQLVGDFRQGFWTFVEDLKQVTVGDENSSFGEALNPPKTKSHGLSKVVEKNKEMLGKDDPAPKGYGQKAERSGRKDEGKPSQQSTRAIESYEFRSLKGPNIRQHGLGISTESDNEGWDNWDSNASSESPPSEDRKVKVPSKLQASTTPPCGIQVQQHLAAEQ